MPALSDVNIESELSYAYLHAVASRAGVACECLGRHSDNLGVDAELHAVGEYAENAVVTDMTVHLQLKATIRQPSQHDDKLSYSLDDIKRYDKLRCTKTNLPRLLVVLFLPEDPAAWLSQTEDELILRKCAYWVSLRGAPPSRNHKSQTVYLPRAQAFDVEGLNRLFGRLALQEDISHAQ